MIEKQKIVQRWNEYVGKHFQDREIYNAYKRGRAGNAKI